MVTYYVKKGDIYKVTATVNCAVYNSNGSTFVTCEAGNSIKFNALSAKISLSDDNAALTRSVESSIDVDGVSEHLANSSIHVSPNEKANWNSTVDTVTQKFPNIESHIDNSTLHLTSQEHEALTGLLSNPSSISTEESDLELHTSNSDIHVTAEDKQTWNNAPNLYAPKNLGVANAILITDADGNVTASTVISVAELNTINNNLTNISTKLSNFESRIAALES